MTLGPHAIFIVAAYGLAGAVIAGLIAWVISDYAEQKKTLKRLEEQGIARRSAAADARPPQ